MTAHTRENEILIFDVLSICRYREFDKAFGYPQIKPCSVNVHTKILNYAMFKSTIVVNTEESVMLWKTDSCDHFNEMEFT